MSLSETPTLFLEFNGTDGSVESQAKLASNLSFFFKLFEIFPN
jgi:hypothetical protein